MHLLRIRLFRREKKKNALYGCIEGEYWQAADMSSIETVQHGLPFNI